MSDVSPDNNPIFQLYYDGIHDDNRMRIATRFLLRRLCILAASASNEAPLPYSVEEMGQRIVSYANQIKELAEEAAQFGYIDFDGEIMILKDGP